MSISLASLNRTTALKPPRMLIHGVHGVGKTTFAAGAPDPVFILTEDGLGTLEVPHFPPARIFDEVMQALAALYTEEHAFRTLVVDSVDWLEPLIHARVCKDQGWSSIEDAGYGKGYVHALDLWRQYIEGLNALRDDKGMAIVQIAHTDIKRFDSPRVRTLRPLRHQAPQQGLGAAAGALGRRAVRELPGEHGEGAMSGSTGR